MASLMNSTNRPVKQVRSTETDSHVLQLTDIWTEHIWTGNI